MSAQVEPIRSRGEATRERILDAAEQQFAEHGYEGTTLREIATAVGIREPSLYTHYANKEAIYAAVIDRALLPFSAALLNWNQSELTVQSLFEVPAKLVALHSRHPHSAQILHREFSSPPQRISPKVLHWQQQFVAQSSDFMARLPDSGVVDKAKVVANMITCTNVILGIFSTRGMQMRLMGEDYNAGIMMAEHLRLANRIFKSLVM